MLNGAILNRDGLILIATNESFSKFQGLLTNKLLKIIDFIGLKNRDGKIYKGENKIIVDSKDGLEYYFLRNGLLFYESLSDKEIIIDIDVRPYKDFPEWERFIDIKRKGSVISVSYRHKELLLNFFLGVGKNAELFIDGWVEKDYVYDRKRKSKSKLWVYRLRLSNASRVVFSFDEKKALFNYGLGRWLKKEELKKELKQLKRKKNIKELSSDLKRELKEFINHNYLMAGFPYFLEEWLRDELFSLKAFMLMNDRELVFNILKRLFKEVKKNLMNGSFKMRSFNNYGSSCDSMFWFWIRLKDYLEIFGIRKEELLAIREMISYLPRFIELIEGQEMICEKKESWMDTIDRNGIPIEIAFMHLSIYDFLLKIKRNDLLSDSINIDNLEQRFRERIDHYHQLFIVTGYDCFPNTKEITINGAIALYVYPDIKEKELIIDKLLKHLWLEWGGFSSLSKFNKQFVEFHSGENNLSYHRGDSWMYLNYLMAINMINTNPYKYKHYILKIIERGLRDFYEVGFHKGCSEISSAALFEPNGCLNQLWSMASLYELILLALNRKILD